MPVSPAASSSSSSSRYYNTNNHHHHHAGGPHHHVVGRNSTILLVRGSQCVMFFLGLTYTIVVLLPLIRHEHSWLTSSSSTSSSSSFGDWRTHFLLQDPPFPPRTHNNNCTTTTTTTSFYRTDGGNRYHHRSSGRNSNQTEKEEEEEDENLPILEEKDRIITLVHVGKAGGVSLRRVTVIYCKLFFRKKIWASTRKERIQNCIHKHFPDPPNTILSHQTQHYFHIEEYNDTEIAQSTSFLITLRNPIDRIISTYRYSHPGNCNDNNRHEVWRPRGCEAEKHKNKTGLIQNDIHYKCFPSPAMEDFAQALMKPWKPWNTNNNNNYLLSKQERRHCRYLAREMVQGHGTYGSAPHMLYNYFYYAQRSIWKYPNKEVFAIRTEHEWDDIVALDRMLGGNANFVENRDVSHGSEGYVPSPLSKQAYQKLCCALESEIEIYQDILERVINLNSRAKQDELESIREKCGIQTTWTEWRIECRRHLRKDLRFLHPSLIVNETKYMNMKVGYDHQPPNRLFARLSSNGRG